MKLLALARRALVALVLSISLIPLSSCNSSEAVNADTPNIRAISYDDIHQTYVGVTAGVDAFVLPTHELDEAQGRTLSGVELTATVDDPTIAHLTSSATVTTASLVGASGRAIAHFDLVGLKAGNATLTLTASKYLDEFGRPFTANVIVKIRVPSRIVFSPSPMSLQLVPLSNASATVNAYVETTSGDSMYEAPVEWSCPAGSAVAQLAALFAPCAGAYRSADITPVKLGTTTFRAQLSPADVYARYPISANLTVNVTAPIASMAIDPPGPLTVGTATTLSAIFKNAAGQVLPTGLTDTYGSVASGVNWTSSNPSVASFASFGTGTNGTLTALQPGTTTITASYSAPDPNKVFGSPADFTAPPVQVTVAYAPGSVGLNVLTAPLNIGSGSHLPDVVQISRSIFTGGVSITGKSDEAESVIPRITITPGETTTTGNQTTLDIDVPAGSTLGTHIIMLTAKAVGLADVTKTFAIVVGASSYTLTPQLATVNVVAGNTGTNVIQVNRNNFNGSLEVVGTSDAGITVTGETFTTGDQMTQTVHVPSGTPLGPHTVNVSGLVTGKGIVNASYTVTVTSGVTNTSYNFCSATGLPVWVAVQDGAGTAPWTAVTGSSATYAFSINSGKGGIAWVVSVGGINQLHVFYGTQAEIAAQGAIACSGSGSTKAIGAGLANTGAAAKAYLSLGQALRIAALPASLIQWTNVAPGSLDVVAATVDAATVPAPISMLIRRNVNGTDGAFLPTALDFGGSSTEAFTPQQTSVALNNSLGQSLNLSFQLHTANNFLSTYYSDGSSSVLGTRTVFGAPSGQLASADMHYVSAVANGSGSGAVPLRTAGMMVKTFASPFTLTFGSALATPVLSTPSAGVIRTAFTVQSEYSKLWQVDFDQISSASKTAQVQMTAGYLGAAATATVDLPNFTGVAGWLTSYGLATGVSTPWKATAASWSGAGVVFPAFVDGATYNSAAAQGTTTP